MKKLLLILLFSPAILTNITFAQPSITWQRTYDGPMHLNDYGNAVCQSTDGNFYVVGSTVSRIYVLKLSVYGDTIWTKIIGSGSDSTQNALSVAASNDGGCVITGDWNPNSFLIKLNSFGIEEWHKVYGCCGIQCFDLKKTVDGGYIACGKANYTYGYILKTDSLGNQLWEKYYAPFAFKSFHSIAEDNHGGYIVAGSDQPDTPKVDIMKITGTGDVVWEKFYTVLGRQAGADFIHIINNGYIIGGGTCDTSCTGSRTFFIKIDTSGNKYYSYIFPSVIKEAFYSAAIANDNKYVFSTFKFTSNGNDTVYAYLRITDSTGNEMYGRRIPALRDVGFNGIAPQSNKDIVFAGFLNEVPGGYQKYDVYVIRTDSTLNFPGVIGINGISINTPNAFLLYQNYPNPFNPETNIKFDLPESGLVSLKVYDIIGREVAELINEVLKRGSYSVNFEPHNLASGIYIYTLKSNDFSTSKKMVYLA